MDTTHNFKKSYRSFLENIDWERVAPDQPELVARARKKIAEREKARKDARDPQIQKAKKAADFFSKSAIRTEEVEVKESLRTENPCWKGYKPVGVKMKKGRKVPNCVPEEFELGEAHMTSADVKKEENLKKKYDPSGMKASMIKQYGPEKGKQVYFATIRKQAMREALVLDEKYKELPIKKMLDQAGNHKFYGGWVQGESEGNRFNARKKAPNTKYLVNLANKRAKGIHDTIINHNPEESKAKSKLKEALELDEAKLSRVERRAKNVGKKGYDTKGKPTAKGGVHAFDVDETLFSHGVKGRPNVKVHVNDPSGKRVKSLTNQEFNTHKLPKGHSYDFSEFRSASKFAQTASPNKKVISQLKRLQKRGKNVQLITARDKFDKPEEFRQHFVRHGIKLAPGDIHYAGGMKGSDIGQKKVAIAKGLAKKGKTSSVHMYDDAAKVHKAFEAEKEKSPKLKIKTHLAKPNKKGEVMTRSYQATKSEEFELWVNSLLDEGYDLSEFTVDELVEAYNELDEVITAVAAPGEGQPKRPTKSSYKKEFKSPYKDRPKKEFKTEETELTPYEFWKSFIGEEEQVEENVIEESIEVDERPLTSYDYWKAIVEEGAGS